MHLGISQSLALTYSFCLHLGGSISHVGITTSTCLGQTGDLYKYALEPGKQVNFFS